MCKELERCTLEIDPIEAAKLRKIIDDEVLQTEGITMQKRKENIWNQCQERITIELPLHKKIPTLSQTMSKCLGAYVSKKDQWNSLIARYFKEQNIIQLDENKRESSNRRNEQKKKGSPDARDDASDEAREDVSDEASDEAREDVSDEASDKASRVTSEDAKQYDETTHMRFNTLTKGERWFPRKKLLTARREQEPREEDSMSEEF